MIQRERSSGWPSLNNIALIGNYLPRKCGIATFTTHLAQALAEAAPDVRTFAVAMNDRPEGYRYPPRVAFEINDKRINEYRLAADYLNLSKVDAVCVQHEFGIFGGPAGQYLGELLRRLRMPVITTLHTVLREPNDDQKAAMQQIVDTSDRLVVLAERAYDFLRDIYNLPKEKIALIPHGIPDVPFVDPAFYKDKFGVEGRKVILTFGLLSPNKGIENMIDALPAIVAKHPDVVYIVLGATHPGVVAHSGEDYRISLRRRAADKGVLDHILFVNKFVEQEELTEFLGAADVYVTPYHHEQQICSGTLAYALGTGNAVVSTPYWYAQEMLAEERGVLVPFKDAQAMSRAILTLFDQEVQRHAMRKRAYTYCRQMSWPRVAGQYLDLFVQVRQERDRMPRPVHVPADIREESQGLTEIKLDHLRLLTDDTGIFQHAIATVPSREMGYSTDDNARALIAVLMAQNLADDASGADLDALAGRYLSFLEHAFNRKTRRFRSTMTYDRRWVKDTGSEVSHARAVWALGEAVARCQVRGQVALAMDLFHRAMVVVEDFEQPLPAAHCLVGMHAYLRRFGGDSRVRRVRENLAGRLCDRFRGNMSDDWPWLDDHLTQESARLALALLLSGRWMFDNTMIETALHALGWLVDVQRAPEGHFAPIGSVGGFRRGGQRARFEQLPLEAHATIDACVEAFHVTRDRQWLRHAHDALNWFLGENDLHLPLYDHVTGGCYDALLAQGLNENQGAQATLSWLLSLLLLHEQRLDEKAPPLASKKPAGEKLKPSELKPDRDKVRRLPPPVRPGVSGGPQPVIKASRDTPAPTSTPTQP